MNMKWILALGLVAGMVLDPLVAHAARFVLQPGPEGKDVSTHPFGDPETKADEGSMLLGSYLEVNSLRIFMKFDVETLSGDALKTLNGPNGRATFSFHQQWNFSAPHRMQARVYRLTEDWDEYAASLDNRTKTSKWATRGGTHAPKLEGMAEFTFSLMDEVEMDLTGMVRDWINGREENFGFVIIPEAIRLCCRGSSTNNYGSIMSSDNADPTLRPKLTIAPVPLPGALPLAMGAVAMLAAVGRRRKTGADRA